MKDLEWFPPIPAPPEASSRPPLWPLGLGAACGLLLLLRGHRMLAIAAWAVASTLTLACMLPPLRSGVRWVADWLARCVGHVTAMCLLWPFYVLVLGSIHLLLSLTSTDILRLRWEPDKPSYWLPAAPEPKRARYYHRLFTIEPSRQESLWRAGAIATIVIVFALAVGGELLLRSRGFGSPILYRVDPRVGYYPAPNQEVHRYGGRIHINAFGMRSRDVSAAKPRGVFRILMLGDSTLYGGSYIDQSEIYATRLEELLNRTTEQLPGSPRGTEVLCMGVNAWGPQHELAYAREFGLFSGDLVMVMGPPEDAYRGRYGVEHLPFFLEGHKPSLAWRELWTHLVWDYRLRSSRGDDRVGNSPQASNVLREGIGAWLGLAALARAQGASVDFEFLPNEDEVRSGHACESTKRVLDLILPELHNQRIPFSYPLDLFRRELEAGRVFQDGAHLNAQGHFLYAHYLEARVKEVAAAQ